MVKKREYSGFQGDDGLLTALEISTLNLLGTELVTISACNTGVGQIITGEGVFGLRRAFQNAGAQSMVVSMWSVPDDISYKLMTGFYENWLKGVSKSDALRSTMLNMMDKSQVSFGHKHPMLWGGFIQLGNPN